MTQYEMVEKLAEKMNVTLEEAKVALEAAEWNMLDAALVLEKEHGTTAQTESDQSCRKDGMRKIPSPSSFCKQPVRMNRTATSNITNDFFMKSLLLV